MTNSRACNRALVGIERMKGKYRGSLRAMWLIETEEPHNKAINSFASLTGTLRSFAAPRPLSQRYACEILSSGTEVER